MEDAYDNIHDVLLEFIDSPSDEQIKQVYGNLPIHLKEEADEWGWSDTAIRESVYEYILGNGLFHLNNVILSRNTHSPSTSLKSSLTGRRKCVRMDSKINIGRKKNDS